MRPLRFSINVTLDGCVDHTVGIINPSVHRHAMQIVAAADALVFGRTTYEMMEAGWRHAPPPGSRPAWMQPFADTINAAKKHVVTSTLASVDWHNAEIVRGDFIEAVRRLKAQPGKGLYTGGVTLPTALLDAGLIDEVELIVHPRIAGHGPRLFDGTKTLLDLEAMGRTELDDGIVATRYRVRR